MNLQGRLNRLIELYPELSQSLYSLKEKLKSLEMFMQRLSAEGAALVEAKEEAERLIEQASAALELDLETQQQAIQQRAQRISQGFKSFAEQILDWEVSCDKAVKSLKGQLESIKGRAQELRAEREEKHCALAEALGAARQLLESRRNAQREALEVFGLRMEQLGLELEEINADLLERYSAFLDLVTEHQSESEDLSLEISRGLKQRQEESQHHFEEAVTLLSSGHERQSEQTREALTRQLPEILAEATTEFSEQLRELIQRFKGAPEDLSLLRESIQPMLEALDGLIHPLKSGSDAVRGVAEDLGVS